MDKVIGGTERMPLTEGLLNLIVMVQEYKEFCLSKSLYQSTNNLKQTSWSGETEAFFNSLDSEVLSKYKLSKNKISFEKVMRYKITDEMKSTESEELPLKFIF